VDKIIVDTCIGSHKPRQSGIYNMRDDPFLERLEHAGYRPEDMDFVMCPHLHVDHVGWNTRLVNGQWVPTFPNARYLFAQQEYDHALTDTMGDQEATYQDSVKPIVDAGLHMLVESDHKLCDTVRLIPTPGHTLGHCSVVIERAGERAIITGDMVHHPLQIADLNICSNVDVDKAVARESRRAFYHAIEDRQDILLGTHFSEPTSVRIIRTPSDWQAVPA
jgi:glyoxylase-like metal-dependent hydrolase (beta-lactamase superfamily II)